MTAANPCGPERLKTLERVFLSLDRRDQPFHVACLTLLVPPPGASAEFAPELVKRWRDTAPVTPFTRLLEHRLGSARWVEDADFDIEQHVVQLLLPAPGRLQDLMALVSRLHATHLDRAYPLWRAYLIEGLSDGRIAIYWKMHPLLADHLGCVRSMLLSMSADSSPRPPPWALPPARGHDSRRTHLRSAANRGRARGWRAGLNVLLDVLPEVREASRDLKAGLEVAIGGRQAPASILNQRISASRNFAARSFPSSRIQALCRHFSCNSEKIALALCASALIRFFEERDALPRGSLIALVPSSMRGCGGEAGDHGIPLLVNLGTDLSDPVERLHRICRSLEYSRQRCLRLGPSEARAYLLATSGRGLLNLLLDPAGGRLPFNVVISAVSGPESTMYWEGCRLDGMYPMSPLIDGLALSISITSREEGLDFGLLACRRTLPHLHRLPLYLESALDELESRASEAISENSATPERQILPPSRAGNVARSQRGLAAGPAISIALR